MTPRAQGLIGAAAVLGLAAALGLWFWAIDPPPARDGCNTSLPTGYGDVLATTHVTAALALGTLIVWLGAGPRERIGLGVAAVLLLACLVSEAVLSVTVIGAFIAAWPVGAVTVIGAGLSLRALRRGRHEHVLRDARLLAWAALVVGLPAHAAAVYLEGASLFCF